MLTTRVATIILHMAGPPGTARADGNIAISIYVTAGDRDRAAIAAGAGAGIAIRAFRTITAVTTVGAI